MENIPNPAEQEQETRKHYQAAEPSLLHSSGEFSFSSFELTCGINNLPPQRITAYWPSNFLDTIIEEKLNDDHLASAEILNRNAPGGQGSYLVFQLITSLGTGTCLRWLAQKLAASPVDFGYASNRESGILSSQFISVPAHFLDKLLNIGLPTGMLLGNFYYSNQPLSTKSLNGNLHTVILRAQSPVDIDSLNLRLDLLNKYGVLNFFSTQRFGLRRNSHILGQLILTGQYEAAVRKYLFESAPTEQLMINRLREVAKTNFPNFEKVQKIFRVLPITFANELLIINRLATHHNDYAGAILSVSNQAKHWLFSYGAFLFNRRLTDDSRVKGITNEQLPWPFSTEPQEKQSYRRYFDQDGINGRNEMDFTKELLPDKRFQIPGRIFPQKFYLRGVDNNIVLSFYLSSNSQAELLLSNLFDIHSFTPLPTWVDTKFIDAKKMLGQGDVESLIPSLSSI